MAARRRKANAVHFPYLTHDGVSEDVLDLGVLHRARLPLLHLLLARLTAVQLQSNRELASCDISGGKLPLHIVHVPTLMAENFQKYNFLSHLADGLQAAPDAVLELLILWVCLQTSLEYKNKSSS